MKKFFSLLLTFVLFCCANFAFAAENFSDNNNISSDNLNDTVKWLESDKYTITDNYVFDVMPDTLPSVFKKSFVNPEKVTVNTNSCIKTGDSVFYQDLPDEVYTVIVAGDVDCNGSVNATDIVKMLDIMQNGAEGNVFLAADIDGNSVINVIDISIAQSIVLS